MSQDFFQFVKIKINQLERDLYGEVIVKKEYILKLKRYFPRKINEKRGDMPHDKFI